MNDNIFRDRITELEQEIRAHRKLYYDQQPEISDLEFDKLIEELETLAPNSQVLAEVGAPTEAGLPKKEHKIPMGSLEKIPEDRLDVWAEKTGPLYLVQEKYDGISLEIEYEKGKLVDAITRGDGFIGEVVTHNAVSFKNVPRLLQRDFTGSVRGEVILRLSTFEKIFTEQGFANPRNTVSGLVRKKHGDRSLNRHFEVFFYDLVFEDQPFETEHQKMLYLRDELGLDLATSHFDQTIDDVRQIYRTYRGEDGSGGLREALDYEIDGLVIRSDSLALQAKLGSRQNRPRYATAYKFPSEGKVTILRAVDWSLGIGSRVTPVARLEPVPIAGVTVSNATLHNVDYIKDLGVRPGDRVYVERRGDVIPQVMRVVESGDGDPVHPPASCPSCEQSLEMDGKFLFCTNASCPGKAYGDIVKWIRELEIDSLGEKWIQILIDANLISRPADLYKLTEESLLPLDRMGKILAGKLVQNISGARHPPLDRFIAGLNIPGFSRQRVQMLADGGVTSLDALLKIDAEHIAEIKGFAEILAQNVVKGLQNRRETIDALLEIGVVPRDAEPTPEVEGSGPLAGKSFCFTGAIQSIDESSGKRFTRKQLQSLVSDLGGKTQADVSSRLDYLVMVNPDSTSSKATKARKHGTEILSEEAFFEMIDQ